jgi:hypothetical protein
VSYWTGWALNTTPRPLLHRRRHAAVQREPWPRPGISLLTATTSSSPVQHWAHLTTAQVWEYVTKPTWRVLPRQLRSDSFLFVSAKSFAHARAFTTGETEAAALATAAAAAAGGEPAGAHELAKSTICAARKPATQLIPASVASSHPQSPFRLTHRHPCALPP